MQSTTIELEGDPGRSEPESSTMDPAKTPADVAPAWSPARRVLFRFVFAYLVLYIFPFLAEWGPGEAYVKFWEDLVPRVGSLGGVFRNRGQWLLNWCRDAGS